jgi:SH3-like domain-containing protein
MHAPTPAPPLVLREAPPSPIAAQPPSPVAEASSSPVAAPRRGRIVGVGQEAVSLRAQPGTRGARVKGLFDGAELELLGHEAEANGRTWRDVRDPTDGSEGWVAAEFLGPDR